jgi:hypothetical protein
MAIKFDYPARNNPVTLINEKTSPMGARESHSLYPIISENISKRKR